MCDCITKVTDEIRNQVKKDTEEKTQVVTWDDPGNFQNTVNIKGKSVISLPFRFAYTRRKHSGEPEKKITNDVLMLKVNFCPFCGKPTAKG